MTYCILNTCSREECEHHLYNANDISDTPIPVEMLYLECQHYHEVENKNEE